MKIGDARKTYNGLLISYNEKKVEIAQKQKDLEEKMKTTEDGEKLFGQEAVKLELSYKALDEKQSEYQKYMEKLMEQETGIMDKIAAEQSGEAMEEYAKDVSKIMMVARRIMKGDRVPPQDEKKLMEYDDKLYQAAKNIGAMQQLKKRKEHKSLWEDEEEKESVDALEEAENSEAFADGPGVVSVEETLSSVDAGMTDITIS